MKLCKLLMLFCLVAVTVGLVGCANIKYPPYSSVHRDSGYSELVPQ